MCVLLQDLKTEMERIPKTNVVVCTPGRLLQHMDETACFESLNLKILGEGKNNLTVHEHESNDDGDTEDGEWKEEKEEVDDDDDDDD